MGYGDFGSDTGMDGTVAGMDDPHLSPDKQRQRLMGAMLAIHARNMAADQATPAPESDTLTSMVKADPTMQQVGSGSSPMQQNKPDMSAFPEKNMGMGENVGLAHASLQDQPATKYVGQAQDALDEYNRKTHGWRGMLAPAILTAGSLLGAHSYNGAHLQDEAGKEMEQIQNRRMQERQSLVNQVQSARTLQQQEYEADQRNRQQDLMVASNNQTKSLTAKILAGSRENVAQIGADSRENVQGSREELGRYVADKRLEGTQYTADQHVKAARYAADAALNRFLAGQDRADQRQQRGFAHTDLKPTADEDRRADLARAAQGYAGALKDIMVRRPELFGQVGQGAYFLGGRGTQLRNMLGSNDPDVAELKYLKEQLGITQMGAHSFRSAQAIAPIADAMVNSFNSGPDAGISVLDHAIEQLNMFTGVQVRPGVVGQTASPGPLTQQVGAGAGAGAETTGEEGLLAPGRPGSRPEFQVSGRTVGSRGEAQPGDEYKGWIYLGGDKNLKSNWAQYHTGGQ